MLQVQTGISRCDNLSESSHAQWWFLEAEVCPRGNQCELGRLCVCEWGFIVLRLLTM